MNRRSFLIQSVVAPALANLAPSAMASTREVAAAPVVAEAVVAAEATGKFALGKSLNNLADLMLEARKEDLNNAHTIRYGSKASRRGEFIAHFDSIDKDKLPALCEAINNILANTPSDNGRQIDLKPEYIDDYEILQDVVFAIPDVFKDAQDPYQAFFDALAEKMGADHPFANFKFTLMATKEQILANLEKLFADTHAFQRQIIELHENIPQELRRKLAGLPLLPEAVSVASDDHDKNEQYKKDFEAIKRKAVANIVAEINATLPESEKVDAETFLKLYDAIHEASIHARVSTEGNLKGFFTRSANIWDDDAVFIPAECLFADVKSLTDVNETLPHDWEAIREKVVELYGKYPGLDPRNTNLARSHISIEIELAQGKRPDLFSDLLKTPIPSLDVVKINIPENKEVKAAPVQADESLKTQVTNAVSRQGLFDMAKKFVKDAVSPGTGQEEAASTPQPMPAAPPPAPPMLLTEGTGREVVEPIKQPEAQPVEVSTRSQGLKREPHQRRPRPEHPGDRSGDDSMKRE